jgi:hypothetical protein
MRMKRYLLILLMIFGIVGSVWGFEYMVYNDITVVNLNEWGQPLGEVELCFLIYNNSNGQVLANVPVSAEFNNEVLNATTDAYGVVKFKVNLSDYSNTLQFIKINNISIPEWRIDFWFAGREYWCSFLQDNYFIAKNGMINISIPISKFAKDKFPPIEIPNNGNITLYVNDNPKTFPVEDGFIKIYLENITSPVDVDIGGYEYGIGHFMIYPNDTTIEVVGLIPEWSDAYKGETVKLALIAVDNDKPITNKTYTVEVVYDWNWDNITTFNITTNEYGIAEFNITANAENWISIEIWDGE